MKTSLLSFFLSFLPFRTLARVPSTDDAKEHQSRESVEREREREAVLDFKNISSVGVVVIHIESAA